MWLEEARGGGRIRYPKVKAPTWTDRASSKTREERKPLKWSEERGGRARPGRAAALTQGHLGRGGEESTLEGAGLKD